MSLALKSPPQEGIREERPWAAPPSLMTPLICSSDNLAMKAGSANFAGGVANMNISDQDGNVFGLKKTAPGGHK